jgi:hypothetical protein
MASFLFPVLPTTGRHRLEPVHDLQREVVNKVKSSAGTGVYVNT